MTTPEDGVLYEVVNGEIQGEPRPLPGHGLSQGVLYSELSLPFHRGRGGPGGWWFIIEPDVRLGIHDIVVPDIVGWRKERMPVFPRSRPIDTVPDWICELLSPSSRNRD